MNYNNLSPAVQRAIKSHMDQPLEVVKIQVEMMSPFEVFDMFLTWHGIINYTHTIHEAHESIFNPK